MFSYTVNAKRTATLCLAFRLFKRRLNGFKRAKRYGTVAQFCMYKKEKGVHNHQLSGPYTSPHDPLSSLICSVHDPLSSLQHLFTVKKRENIISSPESCSSRLPLLSQRHGSTFHLELRSDLAPPWCPGTPEATCRGQQACAAAANQEVPSSPDLCSSMACAAVSYPSLLVSPLLLQSSPALCSPPNLPPTPLQSSHFSCHVFSLSPKRDGTRAERHSIRPGTVPVEAVFAVFPRF